MDEFEDYYFRYYDAVEENKELQSEINRHHEDFEKIRAILDHIDEERLYSQLNRIPPAVVEKSIKKIRNIVG